MQDEYCKHRGIKLPQQDGCAECASLKLRLAAMQSECDSWRERYYKTRAQLSKSLYARVIAERRVSELEKKE